MAKHCERLRQALDLRNMKPSMLSYKTGISEASLSHYLAGHYEPKIKKIQAMAKALHVSDAWLSGLDVPMQEEANEIDLSAYGLRPVTKKRLPMLGNVACGEPIFASEEHEIFIDANLDTEADFCLTAKGDSMINARIFDGDILFVKSQETVNDGEIAVILIEDEATVKRVYYDRENNIITLVPENPMYKPMRYEGERLNQVHILGKIVSGHYKVD